MKHIQVLGIKDKKQITSVISFTTNGTLLLLQIVFQRTTNQSFPPMNKRKITCSFFGFHFTYSSNHWSTLKTTKQFVETSSHLICSSSGKICFDKRPKDGLVDWLLVNSQKWNFFSLDEITIPMCGCHICSSKLHQHPSTYWCYSSMSIQACIQKKIQFLDLINNQVPTWVRWES